MKKLLAILLLFGIVGCSQEPEEVIIEPSLLDKCVASNLTALQDLSIKNEAIDSLDIYIPEDSYDYYGWPVTKEEFTEQSLKYVRMQINGVDSGSTVERMCRQINPEIILNDKQQCELRAQKIVDYLIANKKGNPDKRFLEYWTGQYKCDLEDDEYIWQEEVVVENCLDQSEESLIETFIASQKKWHEETVLDEDRKLRNIRLSLIKYGSLIDQETKASLEATYKQYAEVFNREAKLICNTQGIY